MGSNAESSLHDLNDDLLAIVLQRLLPAPGLVTSRAAVRYRMGFLTLALTRPADRFPGAAHWLRAWQACLSGLQAPSASLWQCPIWCSGREADDLYAVSSVGLPALLVCKRWCRLLLHGTVVKVAVLGHRERPPDSTEVLIVAEPFTLQRQDPHWHPSRQVDRLPLAHLGGLPSLTALILFRGQDSVDGGFDRGLLWGRPVGIPNGLRRLQHLVYMGLHSEVGGGAWVMSSPPMLQGIAALSDLRTLGLVGVHPYLVDSELAAVLAALPRLTTLLAPNARLQLGQCVALTQLRSLATSLLRPDGAEPDVEEPFIVELALLSQLSSLQSLTLQCESFESQILDVTGISALGALTLLDITCFTIRHGAEQIAALTALQSLAISRVDLDPTQEGALEMLRAAHAARAPALVALSPLTRLALSSINVTPVAAAGFAACTGLVDLDLNQRGASDSFEGPPQDHPDHLSALAALTQLTALRLEAALLGQHTCAALALMTRLRRLHLSCCTLLHAGPLRALTRLRSLILRDGTLVSDSNAGPPSRYLPLQLPVECPHLTVLEVCGTTLDNVEGLQELGSFEGHVAPVCRPSVGLRRHLFLHAPRCRYPPGVAVRHDLSSLLPSLEELNLSGSNVTEEGLGRLHLVFHRLKALRVDCCASSPPRR